MKIEELIHLKEKEHRIEFKEAKGGSFSYNGGSKPDPKERRRCILGYVVAFANEGGGKLVFGVGDKHPHTIVGSNQNEGRTGELEQNIYRDLKIRVKTEELFDNNKRVLIIHIPNRPVGKFYVFEDVPLMRVGEELLPMSLEKQREILLESENDFTSEICEGVTMEDLDNSALQKMKEKYAEKQHNELFLTLPNKQILSDLGLSLNNCLTFAAVILLGKKEIIEKKFHKHEYFMSIDTMKKIYKQPINLYLLNPIFC